MKYLLLFIIRCYWLIPKSKRRKCIFRKSCSHFVYEETIDKGLKNGIVAFKYRFKNCRAGFEVYTNPINKELELLLPSGEILKNTEISNRFNNTEL